MKKEQELSVVEPGAIAQRIFVIRKQKVMLDFHLAELYGVATMRLNEQVKRNKDRFPADFMFQLSQEEYKNLISQFAISSSGYGGRRQLPYVFTEHGVAMLSSVLRSSRAVQMNIFIIRAFVKIRELLATNKDLARKLEELERTQSEHDENLAEIYAIIKDLIDEPIKPPGKMGFGGE
jgi:hypothetical protein